MKNPIMPENPIPTTPIRSKNDSKLVKNESKNEGKQVKNKGERVNFDPKHDITGNYMKSEQNQAKTLSNPSNHRQPGQINVKLGQKPSKHRQMPSKPSKPPGGV